MHDAPSEKPSLYMNSNTSCSAGTGMGLLLREGMMARFSNSRCAYVSTRAVHCLLQSYEVYK